MKLYIIIILLIVFSRHLYAYQPSYCYQDNFLSHEISAPISYQNLFRLRMFRLGKVTLVGLGIGNSNVEDVKNLARYYSAEWETGFCTWYINEGNREAEKSFNHKYVKHPMEVPVDEIVNNYLYGLKESFTTRDPSFWSCAENQGYIAIGCHGHWHRGPSAFGMLLAFSGCTPEQSINIVNTLWELNGVSYDARWAIINAGYQLGHQHHDLRMKLQRAFQNLNN